MGGHNGVTLGLGVTHNGFRGLQWGVPGFGAHNGGDPGFRGSKGCPNVFLGGRSSPTLPPASANAAQEEPEPEPEPERREQPWLPLPLLRSEPSDDPTSLEFEEFPAKALEDESENPELTLRCPA